MSTTRIVLQPAFVLHTRPYRDSSRLVELFTSTLGRVTVVARGVRGQKSHRAGLLLPFIPLLVSFSGRGELPTLGQVEVNGVGYTLRGELLLSGFYLNELLIRLVGRHDPQPNIYQCYQQTLTALSEGTKPEVALRLFEKWLLADLGYGLQLGCTVTGETVIATNYYSFEFGVGLQTGVASAPNNYPGSSLLALHREKLITQTELRDAKRLLRTVFAILLVNKPIKSRELFIGTQRGC